jgi:hypothetical protein
VNSFVSSAQTLLNTSILDIKKFINIELAGPAGPTRPFRGESLPSSLHQSSISHLAACSATFLWVVYAGRAHGFGWPCWGRQVYPGELWKSGRWRLPVSGETHTHMHTDIFIHTHMHIYIHSHMHIFIHSHLHIFIHSHMHIDIHSLMHFYIHSHMHIDIHSHTFIYIHIHIHTFTYIYIHSHTYTYDGVAHMFLYKYISTCICSYLHVSDCLF